MYFFEKRIIFALCKFTINIWILRILKKIVSYITKYVLPLMVGVGIFWLLYRQFDFKEILSILSQDMNYFWVVLSMLIGVISHISRALRWQLQLRTLNITPSFGTLCNAIFGTYAFNLVLPRFGELWRCTYMAGHENASFSRVFGSMLSDRIVDGITAITIVCFVFLSQVGIVSSFLEQNPTTQQNIHNLLSSPWLYITIVGIIAIFIYLFMRKGNNPILNRIQSTLRNMAEGFNSVLAMKSGKILFLFYTIMIWGCYFLQLYNCIFAFDWMSHTTIMQALVLFVLGSLGMTVPVQGGIGPWHAAVIFGMLFYGFTQEQAGAFALVAHGSQMIVTILLGIYTTIAILCERRQKNNLKN